MLLGALLAAALPKLGPGAFAVPAVVALAAAVVVRPDLALLVLTGAVVLVEGDSSGFLPGEGMLYESVFRGLTVIDYVFLLIVAGVALDLLRRRVRPAGAGPMTVGLALLALALLGGVMSAHVAGVGAKEIFPEGVRLAHVILLPFVVVELIRRRPWLLDALLKVLVGVVALKCVVGVGLALVGGRPAVEGQTVTYLQPTVNWLVVTFLLVVVARVVRGERPPWPVFLLSAVGALELLLSYRRSFWIAAVLGLAVVLLLGGPRVRLAVVLAAGALGIGAYVVLSGAGGTATSTSPIVARAVSLAPTNLSANAEDRYRLDERRNVLAELSRHPLTGLGIGVPWAARYPLPLEHEGGRTYVHAVALYFWLKLGLLGLAAYLALQIGAMAACLRVWRRDPDHRRRALGLGLLASLIGLAVAETTASFTAVDQRFSLVEPIVFGLLAAVWLGLGARERQTA